MEIPDYRARALLSRLRRIISRAELPPGDYRTADAVRLVKADMRWIEKRLPPHKK